MPTGKYTSADLVQTPQKGAYSVSDIAPEYDPSTDPYIQKQYGNAPGYWERFTNPVGSGAREQGIGAGILQVGGQAIKAMAQPFVHPLDAAAGMANLAGAAFSGNPANAAAIIQPMAEKYAADVKQGGHALALTNIAGQTLGGIEGGRLLGAAIEKSGLPTKFEAAKQYVKPTSSTAVVPATETAAERLTQAIRPAGGIKPNTVSSVEQEAPAVVEYAQRTGNPLNTRAEGLKAAQGVAEEGLQHSNQYFVEPNKNVQLQLPVGESPTLGSVTTVEKVVKRISDINDQMRATSGKSEGATMTAEQRTGLEGEVKSLRQRLYNTLSEKTGVPADQIRDMREGYGGQYAIADALQSGRMDTLGREAAESQSFSASPTKSGIVTSLAHKIPGMSESAIADRQFATRIREFPAQAPNRPMPNPPVPRQGGSVPLSPEMVQQLTGTGEGVPTLHRYTTPQPPSNTPLPSVNAVPTLKADADVATRLRAEGNARFQAIKAAQIEAKRQAEIRAQQLLERAKEKQRQARVR